MLLDLEASGVTFLHGEDHGREGDVLEHHVLKKGPEVNAEQPVPCARILQVEDDDWSDG